jgi:hypothetical protein
MSYAESAFAPTRIHRLAMEEWLARSGACPLSISIWVSREAGFGGVAMAAANPFVEAILPLSNRWKHIELRVPADSLDSFHYLQGSDVPLLQTLAITNGSSFARDDWYASSLQLLFSLGYLNLTIHAFEVCQPTLSSTCPSALLTLADA